MADHSTATNGVDNATSKQSELARVLDGYMAAVEAGEIEAQAAALLHHTNIVPIFSVGCERGVHFYAMQYIKGQTVAGMIGDLTWLTGQAAPDGASTGISPAEEVASGRLGPAPVPSTWHLEQRLVEDRLAATVSSPRPD